MAKDGKTEDPTDRKKDESRKEGQIAKSADLVAWIAILVIFTILERTVVNAARFLSGMIADMAELIIAPDVAEAIGFFTESLAGAAKVVAPLAIGYAAVAVLCHFAQVRFLVTFKAMKPQAKRLNPLSGFKRIFSTQSVFQAGKEIFKTVVMAYIAYATLWDTMTGLVSTGPYNLSEVIRVTSIAVMDFIRQVAVAGIVIGVVDYFYQRHKTKDGMKMSHDEIKREHRQQDGSPELKSRIRSKQRLASRNRMMTAMKDADVVVVNPVHVAVALQYDPIKGAPRVVAKGAGFVAEKIREKAEEHKIPLVQDIPLARTLHHVCDIDDEIPAEMFEAVAKLLAFVFGLKSRISSDGLHKMPGSPDLAEYEAAEARKEAEARFKAGTEVKRPAGV